MRGAYGVKLLQKGGWGGCVWGEGTVAEDVEEQMWCGCVKENAAALDRRPRHRAAPTAVLFSAHVAAPAVPERALCNGCIL